MHKLSPADYIVFFIYFIAVSAYGYYIYHKKKSATMSSNDFVLAEGSLRWWAIGASLIASNISAEHFIGMSGSGFALGLAISTYEWASAASLIIVAVSISCAAVLLFAAIKRSINAVSIGVVKSFADAFTNSGLSAAIVPIFKKSFLFIFISV